MHRQIIGALATLCLTLTPLVASATIVTYTDKTAFLAAIADPATDTFDDLSLGLVPEPLNRSVGDYTYVATVDDGTNFVNSGSATDTWLSPEIATDRLTFSGFSSNVFGVGGFFFNTGLFGNVQTGLSVTVSVVDADGGLNETLPNTTPTTFLGFVSTTGITQLRVAANQPTGALTWATANDLVLGDQPTVPEPGTLALIGLGLAAARWRKK